MKGNLEYKIEHLGSHHGQDDMEIGLYKDGDIIGVTQYVLFNGELTVSDIFVRPEFRRQGFGSKMMKYIKQEHPEYKYTPSMMTDLGAKFVHKDIDINEVRRIVKDVLSESVFEEGEDRKLGKSIASQMSDPFVMIYRAVGKNVDVFKDRDYITRSKRFAIEHAESNHVVYEEPQHVIAAYVPAKYVFDAYNPGEYFYSGPDKNGKEIYVSLGPGEYEGLDENDYRGVHTMHKDSSSSPLHNLLQSGQVAKDFYENIHHYAYLHNKSDQESVNIIKQARNKPDATVVIYRAVPKGVSDINPGDWISLSKSYAKHHGLHHEDPKLNMPVISKKVKAKDIWWDGNDVNEFSYFPGGLSEGSIIRESKLDSKKMKKVIRTDYALLDILDSTEASGSDWGAGGCWILADALSEYYGVPLYVVYNSEMNRIDHFLVKVGSMYMDGDGLRTSPEVIQTMVDDGAYIKDINNLKILPYSSDMNSDVIVRDIEASKKLVDLFIRAENELSELIRNHKSLRESVRKVLRENIFNEKFNVVQNVLQITEPYDKIQKSIIGNKVVYILFGDVDYYQNKESIKAIKRKSSEISLDNDLYKNFLQEFKKRFYSIPELSNSNTIISIETTSVVTNEMAEAIGKLYINSGFKKQNPMFKMKDIDLDKRSGISGIFNRDFDASEGEVICIIDDFITTGTSFKNAFDTLQEGANAVGVCLFKLNS